MNRAPAIEFDGVTKRFGPILANDCITCRVAAGSVHAFLGENGAGKSTLMKLLSGSLQPDTGSILLDTSPVTFASPDEARRSGVGVVHQHFTLVPAMSVLDNILLGDRNIPFFLSRNSLIKKIEAAAAGLGFEFNFFSPVWKLSISERQKLEIFKLLWRDARILVLDEPTSQLAPFESEEILILIGRLASEGRTVLLVTHRISEVLRFASRVSVLRKGRCITTMDTCDASMDGLARLMVGDLATTQNDRPAPKSVDLLLALRDVFLGSDGNRPTLKGLSIDIRGGEILGVAGVAGSGRDEFAAVLTGQLVPIRGSLENQGRRVPWRTLQKSECRAAHVPADPVNQGTAKGLPVLDNLFLGDTEDRRFRRGPFLRYSLLREEALHRIESFGIQPPDPEVPCAVLSGGNLQRLVLAREMALSSSLLVTVNPTAGLDLAAARMVKNEIQAYAVSGRAVVLVSYDLQQLLDICDRIAVFFNGELVGVESTKNIGSDWIGLLMGGVRADIIPALLRSELDDEHDLAESRIAIFRLLESPSSWQRRLGLEIGLRVLDCRDAPAIERLAQAERNEDLRAWFAVLLARLAADTFLDRLFTLFEENPGSFLAVQRSLATAKDEKTLEEELRHRVAYTTVPWERALASLTLRYFGARIDTSRFTAARNSTGNGRTLLSDFNSTGGQAND